MTRYLIGIDLGTTNSALAYIDLQSRKKGGTPKIEHFPIPQLVKQAETTPRDLVAVVSLSARPARFAAGRHCPALGPGLSLIAVGEFARNHGARIPGRLVTSAKSWLCHAGVDRSAPLLPWSAPPDVTRISPVEASARYLRHMSKLELREGGQRPKVAPRKADRSLDGARVLRRHGPHLDRRSGPQSGHGKSHAAGRAASRVLLLAGDASAAGGRPHQARRLIAWSSMSAAAPPTSASSRPSSKKASLGFVRQAVGDHLLLGRRQHGPGTGQVRRKQAARCGQARRRAIRHAHAGLPPGQGSLLRPNPPASFPVTVMGRGRQVIGGSLNAHSQS